MEARSLNYWTGRYVSKNIQQQRWVGVGSVSKDVHKTIIQKIHTPLCYSSTIHNSQDVETIWMSTDRWMHKLDMVHIYNGVLLSHQKPNDAICSNTDAAREYHTKWSKSERERLIPYDITYMWNLKYGHKWTNYKVETDSDTEDEDLWMPRGKGMGRMDCKFEINRCKLLYIEWTQGSIFNILWCHNGKEYEKECVCIYNWIPLLYNIN